MPFRNGPLFAGGRVLGSGCGSCAMHCRPRVRRGRPASVSQVCEQSIPATRADVHNSRGCPPCWGSPGAKTLAAAPPRTCPSAIPDSGGAYPVPPSGQGPTRLPAASRSSPAAWSCGRGATAGSRAPRGDWAEGRAVPAPKPKVNGAARADSRGRPRRAAPDLADARHPQW